MRVVISTTDTKPRRVITLDCDFDLLVACVKDGEIIPGLVAKQLNKFVHEVTSALHKGVAKRKEEGLEKPDPDLQDT